MNEKKTQFQAQATKAGKAEELSYMEENDTMRYLELFESFCASSEMRGRPCDSKKFDWSVVSSQTAGVRDSCETISEYLCDADFVHYYTQKAPAYESVLAIVILLLSVVNYVCFCHCARHILYVARSIFAVIRIEQGRCASQMGSRLCQ